MKRNKPDNDILIKILFLAGFFMAAFACFVLYVFFLEKYAVLFVLSIIFTALYTYFFTEYFQHKNIEKHTNDLVDEIENLTHDDPNFEYRYHSDRSFARVFASLAMVKSVLKQKNSHEEELRNVTNSIALNMDLNDMLNDIMPKLVLATKSSCGAFYLANTATGKLELKHSIGFSKNIYTEFDITMGEGLVGAAASEKEMTVIDNIPDDTIYIVRTVLGKIKPKSIVVVPVHAQDTVIGTMLFASIQHYYEDHLEFMNKIKYYLGIAISNGMTYEQSKRLANELKFQNKLIQDLNDDLERKVQNRIQAFNDMLDSIGSIAICAVDKALYVTTWNKSCEVLFSVKAGDAIGCKINDVEFYDEHDKPIFEALLANLKKGESRTKPIKHMKKDGTTHYAEVSVFPISNEYSLETGYTFIIRNITA